MSGPLGGRTFVRCRSAEGAVRFEAFGVPLLAASLADIIRSKEAVDRPQDRQDVVVLREMLRRQGPTERK
ncbi:MAG: hypothetical protein ACREQL_14545 [Candidatus Binatia bacterium]